MRETYFNSIGYGVRRALLLVLRATGASLVQDIRDARMLPRAAKVIAPTETIDKLIRQLVLFGEELCSDGQRDALIELLYTQLKPYFPDELYLEIFKGLGIFKNADEKRILNASTSARCEISFEGRTLNIGLGTAAGMKGETHAASLVLESYCGTSRKFDMVLGLEYMAGTAAKNISKLPKAQQAQMRNLYVAMSQPKKLLCLAANEDRVSQALRDALVLKGWHIEDVT